MSFRILLVVVIIIAASSVVSAAAFTDVDCVSVSAAAQLLSDIGIVTGFPDGTLRPSEEVTRGQFVTLAVRALGLSHAAEYAVGPTMFPDVRADHWAAGYVNVGVAENVLQGYPDGTMRPERMVSHAEVITVLVKMLGYDPELKAGMWPGLFVNKAREIGLADVSSSDLYVPASRGDVIVYLEQALLLPRVNEQQSLAEYGLGLMPVQGLVVGVGPDGHIMIDGGMGVVTVDTSIEHVDGLLGHDIKGFVDDGVLVTFWARPVEVIWGVVTDVDGNRALVGDEWYLLDDAVCYLNRQRVDAGDIAGYDARISVRDGQILVIDSFDWEQRVVIESVDPELGFFRARGSDGVIVSWSVDTDRVVVYRGDGVVSLGDIEPMMVAEHIRAGSTDILSVSDHKVSGTLSVAGDEIFINGARHGVCSDMTVSVDGSELMFDKCDAQVLAALAGKDVTTYLTGGGSVRHISANVEQASLTSSWAVVTSVPIDRQGSVQLEILNDRGRGQTIDCPVDGEFAVVWRILTGAGRGDRSHLYRDLNPGDVVRIDYDRQRPVRIVEPHMFSTDLGRWTIHTENRAIEHQRQARSIADDAFIVDLHLSEVIPVDVFLHTSFPTDTPARMYPDAGDIEVIAFDGGKAVYPDVLTGAVVVTRYLRPEGQGLRVMSGNRSVDVLITNNTTVNALTGQNTGEETDKVTDLDAGDYIRYRLTAAERLHTVTEMDVASEQRVVYEVDVEYGILRLQDTEYGNQEIFFLTDQSQIYDLRSDILFTGVDSIRPGQVVRVFIENGFLVQTLIIDGDQ